MPCLPKHRQRNPCRSLRPLKHQTPSRTLSPAGSASPGLNRQRRSVVTLFDDSKRTDPSPASHLEDHFSFLNRVATPYWERVRTLLTDWVDRLPQDERASVI